MKTLMILFCAIALASANYTPIWNNCGNSSDVFTPSNVTVQKDPKNETRTLISACGTVNSHGSVTIFNRLQVDQSDGTFYSGENLSYRRVVPSGSAFCLNYSGDYTNSHAADIYFKMTASTILGNEAGCVNMTLKYTNLFGKDGNKIGHFADRMFAKFDSYIHR